MSKSKPNITIEHTEGLIAAAFSPLDDAGKLNLGIIPKYAQFLQKNGVIGVFSNGTSGEGYSLTTQERMSVTEAWVKAAKSLSKPFRIIAQIGHACIEDTKAMAAHAQSIGAYGIATMAPIFFKPSNVEDLVNHCALEAAAAPDIHYFYYHIPQLHGVDFPMIEFIKLAEKKIPNFSGIKYSKFELSDYRMCVDYRKDGKGIGKYDITFCQDETLLSAMNMGARGSIGSTYNFDAPLTLKIMSEFKKGNIPLASDLQLKAIQIVDVMKKTGCYFAAAKAIMKNAGIDLGVVRSPLRNLSKDTIDKMFQQLSELGFSELRSQ